MEGARSVPVITRLTEYDVRLLGMLVPVLRCEDFCFCLYCYSVACTASIVRRVVLEYAAELLKLRQHTTLPCTSAGSNASSSAI